jgi:CheY-like chemotaxis protein
VLVIEDLADAAESLRMLLRLSGHEVEVAHTGEAGVAAARQGRPDVVLCDIGLPGDLDGYGVARALRADPEQAGVTLLALSGYGQEEDQRRAREAGFDRHLTKPVDPQALVQLLATLHQRR